MSSTSYERLKIVRAIEPQPIPGYKKRLFNYGGKNIQTLTDIGYEKDRNEDFVIQFDHGVIMCDGVGGSKNGDIAAQFVAKTAYELLTSEYLPLLTIQYRSLKPIQDILTSFVERLNAETFTLLKEQMILRNQELRLKDIGFTTLSMALEIEDNLYVCFSVGDSLIYKKNSFGIDRVIGSHCRIDSVINRNVKKAKLLANLDGLENNEKQSLVKEAFLDALNRRIPNPTMIRYSIPMPNKTPIHFNYNLIRLEYGESLFVLTDGVSDCILMENLEPENASPDNIMQLALDSQMGKKLPYELAGRSKVDNLTISEIKYKEIQPPEILNLQEEFKSRHNSVFPYLSSSYRDDIPEAYIPHDVIEFKCLYRDRLDAKLQPKKEGNYLHYKSKIMSALFDDELKLFDFVSSVTYCRDGDNCAMKMDEYNEHCQIILDEIVAAAIELNDFKIICNLLYVLRAYIKTKNYSNYTNRLNLYPEANFDESINKLKRHLLNNFDINKLKAEDVQSSIAIKSVFGIEIRNIAPFKIQFKKLKSLIQGYYYDYELDELSHHPFEISEHSQKHPDRREMYRDIFEGILIFHHLTKHAQEELQTDLQSVINEISTIDILHILNIEKDYNFFRPLIKNLIDRISKLEYEKSLLIIEKINNFDLKLDLLKHAIYSSRRMRKLNLLEKIKKYFGKLRLNKMSDTEQYNFVFKYYTDKEFDQVFTNERIYNLCNSYFDLLKSLTIES